jgi:hypothetical protein
VSPAEELPTIRRCAVTHLDSLQSSSKQGYLASRIRFSQAAAVTILQAQDGGQPRAVDSMNRGLSCICSEIDLHRANAAQALGNQGNSLGGKKAANEGCILFPNGRRLELATTFPAPNTLATSLLRSPPSFMMALISNSMACTP